MTDNAKTPPTIEVRENGQLRVSHLDRLVLRDGTQAEPKPVVALCRCGQSRSKPYCDGSHRAAGFDGSGQDVTHRDRLYEYTGQDATVTFNKLLCSHSGECGKRAAQIFDPGARPWVRPDQGTLDQIEEVIANCPSGALRYALPGDEPQAVTDDEVSITVERNGPYRVRNVALPAEYWAKGQTPQKYVLCRCGLSQNKPFCDGTHYEKRWRDGG